MNAILNRRRRGSARAGLTRFPLVPTLLASALWAALPAGAAEHVGPVYVNDGTSKTLGSDDVVRVSNNSNVVWAAGSGSTIIVDGSRLEALGPGGGATALDGGHVVLRGATIAANANTLYANGAGSVIDASNVSIVPGGTSTSGTAMQASTGGIINFTGGDITLSNINGSLVASDAGSAIHLDGVQVNAARNGRLRASNAGLLTVRDSQIAFAPGGSLAGFAVEGTGGRVEVYDSQVDGGWFDVGGGNSSLLLQNVTANSVGGSLRVMGNTTTSTYATADIEGGSFSTVGGYGVNINNWGSVSARNAAFDVRDGFAGFWLSSDESRLQLTDSTVDTWTNSNGHGVEVYSGEAKVVGGAITTHGDSVYGLRVTGSTGGTYSRMDASGTTLTVAGNGGGGVFLGGSAVNAALDNLTIRGAGTGAFGLTQMNTAVLSEADALDIRMTGDNSGAYRSYLTAFGPYWNRASFTNSNFESASGPALWVQGSNHALTLDNSTVTAGNGSGRALRVSDTVFTDGSSIATSQIDVNATNGSTLLGDISVDSPTAQVNVALTNGSLLHGALVNSTGNAVAQLSVDNTSQWAVRGDSSVGTLNHAGNITFDAPTSGVFKTVTVTGDYVGQGGQWVFNRALGDDASPGDQLVIEGNSSGTASVSVNNAGGAGADTVEGIRLITVAGQSDATFNLQGRAVAGAYDYFLYKGGVTTPDDGNWYLRSVYVDPVDPVEPPDPIDPVDPVDPVVPVDPVDPVLPVDPVDPTAPVDPIRPEVERPESGSYLANQSAAQGMFRHSLYDRAGDPAAQANGDDRMVTWARVRSNQPEGRNASGQLHVDSHVNSALVGVGRRFAANEGGELQVGAMLGVGHASNDTRSSVTGYTSRGVVDGSTAGLYATWLQNAQMDGGAYVDGWVQYGRFRNRVQGEGLAEERYRSHSWTGSAEAGYTLPLTRNEQRVVYLEPQVQVIHSRYDADRVVEQNGTVVEHDSSGNTTTRVGVRLYTRAADTAQHPVQPYVALNWWNGGNDAAIRMDGEALRRPLPQDIYEAKAGVQVNLGGSWRGWGELNRQSGGMGFRDIGAQMGVSYRW